MGYSINPNLPKARATAMKLLVCEALPVSIVANKCGVHRSTIWRWKNKWAEINKNVQLTNDGRVSRPPMSSFRMAALKWHIPTITSRPHTCSHAISQKIVRCVMGARHSLQQRCAEVVWHHLVTNKGVKISLSSVRRILKRNYAFDGARKNRVRPDNPKRPQPTKPGELVQTDTIHYVCPRTYRRRYVYTVIDLFTRMAYAEVHPRILPGIAASVVINAQRQWKLKDHGYSVSMIQADNGPEFSKYFEQRMKQHNIQVRHSRLGRPNDNAHVERFNRTIQEECLGSKIDSREANATLQAKINKYIEFYNTQRVHLGIQLKIPSEMLQSS